MDNKIISIKKDLGKDCQVIKLCNIKRISEFMLLTKMFY